MLIVTYKCVPNDFFMNNSHRINKNFYKNEVTHLNIHETNTMINKLEVIDPRL